jgi:glycosyltransferase involved in cell wall biosynthesis
VNSKIRVVCFVAAESQFNSIRIQTELMADLLRLSPWIHVEVLNPGFEDYQKCLKTAIFRGDLIFWHFGGFDRHLNPFSYHPNLVLVYHNITPSKYFWLYNPLTAFGSLVGRWQLRQINKNTKCIGLSKYNRAELLLFGFKDVDFIPNIVSTRKSKGDFAKDIQPSLIFVGRMAPNKGCLELLDAIKAVGDKIKSPLTMYFVGDSKIGCRYGERVKLMINGINLAGKVEIQTFNSVSDTQLKMLYQKSWLYVSMSRHEGFGLPACESVISGTPAFYTPSGGQESVLDNIGLVNCYCPRVFADAIVKVLHNPALLNDLLVKQKRVVDEYSEANVSRQLAVVCARYCSALGQ